jgi:riboflavin kinase / FMN adenylyltransferase
MSRLFRDLEGGRLSPRGCVVCIGAFDGLHLGHRALLDRVRSRAREAGLDTAVLSFEPLPREFFSPSDPPARLMLPHQRVAALQAFGIDHIGLLRFNAALASTSAEDFVRRVLVARLGAREVWVGPEFRFGKARRGDIALLRAMGAELGFTAHEVDTHHHAGERVSSSVIRAALAAGDLPSAEHMLGRPYALSGRVVRGRQLGRKLGYPTANIRLQRRRAALGGIFAVRVHGVDAAPRDGVASLGTRPTVDGVEPLLEAHVFDFDGDLYGRRLQVEFVAKLRDELKFDDLPALVAQMDLDAAQARRLLQTAPAPELRIA